MSACLAAILPFLSWVLFVAVTIARIAKTRGLQGTFWQDLPGASGELLIFLAPAIGFGVLSSWSLIALQGRWRADRGWIDRLGRAVGVLWILVMALSGVFWWERIF